MSQIIRNRVGGHGMKGYEAIILSLKVEKLNIVITHGYSSPLSLNRKAFNHYEPPSRCLTFYMTEWKLAHIQTQSKHELHNLANHLSNRSIEPYFKLLYCTTSIMGTSEISIVLIRSYRTCKPNLTRHQYVSLRTQKY